MSTHQAAERILAAVQAAAEGADDIGSTVSADSTVCRAHQYAAGARKKGGSRPGRTRRPCARMLSLRRVTPSRGFSRPGHRPATCTLPPAPAHACRTA